MLWAKKLEGIRPFHVMEILQRANHLQSIGRDIVRLGVGEPDFPTPKPVLDAARQALDEDQTCYTPSLGMYELRTKVAGWYRLQYGVNLNPERVIITAGTSGAFVLAFGLLLNPGERVAIADPGYPCYPNIIRFLGGEPVSIPVGPEHHYQLDAPLLEPQLDAGLRAVLVTSPSNPTGTLIPDAAFDRVTNCIETAGGVLISDEIYHGITYEVKARTALEFSDRAIVINGFSKYFAMTGWRLGWMIIPEDAIRLVEILVQNLYISASTLSQYAALSAFECEPILRQQIQNYDLNRKFLVDSLREMRFDVVVEPKGAFYIYAHAGLVLQQTGISDTQSLCHILLEEASVAVTPGLDFGHYQADQHLRFSYATDRKRLKEGVRRIAQFLAQYRQKNLSG